MAKDFSNKIVLVTGGAQGIGKGIVQAFSHQGAKVLLMDKDKEAGEECVEWLKEKGAEVVFFPVDLADAEAVEEAFSEIINRYQRLDVLVNNAGLSEFSPFLTASLEHFDRVIHTNLRAAWWCSRLAAPELIKHKGSIIFIVSTRAMMSEPGGEAYGASKGALLSLTHALANSLGPEVRVNAISPGWIEVRDWQKKANRQAVKHSEADQNQHLVGRVGRPEDIGRAAVFLASGEASFITGQNLVIDGGMTVKMIYEA